MCEYVYEKNIKNIRKFFKTEWYEKLEENLIKNASKPEIIFYRPQYIRENYWLHLIKYTIGNGFLTEIGEDEKIYQDPDGCDFKLYEYMKRDYIQDKCNLKKEINGKIVRFSLDCVIGWKAILDCLYSEWLRQQEKKGLDELKEKFISLYGIVRKPENKGHLLWPVHNLPTINIERYQKFNDRVDYTLFDIKNYFDIKNNTNAQYTKDELKLKKAYFNKREDATTEMWLNSFENFEDFVKKQQLNIWCDEEYNIKDLASENPEKNKISSYLCKDEIYDAQEKYPITKQYIENLKNIISKNDTGNM